MKYSQITHAYAFKWEQDKSWNPITEESATEEDCNMFEYYIVEEILSQSFNNMNFDLKNENFELDYEDNEVEHDDMDFDCWKDY